MQTILGANGQIGEELARELKRSFTSDIRIVSRKQRFPGFQITTYRQGMERIREEQLHLPPLQTYSCTQSG